MTQNALSALDGALPKFDLVGPTLDDDVRRIIARYGASAVKEAVARQTKAKRGRKPEKDWNELKPHLEADAIFFLKGDSQFLGRSNYSIAKDFADKHSSHSHPATMRRIERKLAKNRMLFTLYEAERIARTQFPYADYLRAIDELLKVSTHPVWMNIRAGAVSDYSDYVRKIGSEPPFCMSIDEIEKTARNAVMSLSPAKRADASLSILEKYLPENQR